MTADPFKTSEAELMIAVLHAFDHILIDRFGITEDKDRTYFCKLLGAETGTILGKIIQAKIKKLIDEAEKNTKKES